MKRDLLLELGLPANLEAERCILGSVLLDGERMHDLRGVLNSGDWSLDQHQRIWAAMCAMYDEGRALSVISLADELHRTAGKLEALGGPSYLLDLSSSLPRFPNLDGYVKLVLDKALYRRLIVTGHALIDRCAREDDRPQALLESALQGFIDLAPDDQSSGGWESMGDVIARVGIGKLMGPRDQSGVPFPWPTVQEEVLGLQPGELVILAARPSVGKTAAMNQICYSAAFRGTAALFSLEQSPEALTARMITQVSAVDAWRSKRGRLTAVERERHMEASAQIAELPLYVEKHKSVNVPGIHVALRRLRTQRGAISLVAVDYLGLMEAVDHGSNTNAARELGTITRGLKLLAGEFHVPVLLLCQLNRASEKENRPPTLTDLRESGRIEEDADKVLFLHRKKTSDEEEKEFRDVDLMIGKDREGNAGFSIKLMFHKPTLRFLEAERNG